MNTSSSENSIKKHPKSENPIVKILKIWQYCLANFSKGKGYFRCEISGESPKWSNGMVLNVIDKEEPKFLQECLDQILDANKRLIQVFNECPIKIYGRNLIFAVIPKAVNCENPHFRPVEMYAVAHGKGITLNKEEYPPIVAPIFNTELFAWNRRDDNDWGNATYEDRHLFLHLLIQEHPYFQNYNSIK